MPTLRFHPWLWAGVAAAAVVLLPLNLLSLQPLHQDEALYATWAQQIASGQDVWLSQTAIDKPPLYLYVLAGAMRLLGSGSTAARLPSLLASAATVLLTFWLGRRLYNPATGLLAAWLAALSPFTLMFAPTAFTDPLLVALVLGSAVAAAHGRAGWAGFWLGLAIATKQQGVLFVPLAAGIGLIAGSRRAELLRFGLALAAVALAALGWDMARSQPAGFLAASSANYGGLFADPAAFAERWQGFADLLALATASPLLNGIFLAGLPLLLAVGGWQIIRRPVWRFAAVDWLLAGFALAFLLLHALFSFQVWDRYLLGLIPLLALLLARILLLPLAIYDLRPVPARVFTIYDFGFSIYNSQFTIHNFWAGVIALLLAVSLARPVQDAINARYPLGSHSDALRGIEQITAYLQGHAGANSTLYHHWLGPYWRFYLADYPYDLQYWAIPIELAARARPGHLITFPTNRSETEARIALAAAGLRLQELTRAFAPDGRPTIILYRLEAADASP